MNWPDIIKAATGLTSAPFPGPGVFVITLTEGADLPTVDHWPETTSSGDPAPPQPSTTDLATWHATWAAVEPPPDREVMQCTALQAHVGDGASRNPRRLRGMGHGTGAYPHRARLPPACAYLAPDLAVRLSRRRRPGAHRCPDRRPVCRSGHPVTKLWRESAAL